MNHWRFEERSWKVRQWWRRAEQKRVGDENACLINSTRTNLCWSFWADGKEGRLRANKVCEHHHFTTYGRTRRTKKRVVSLTEIWMKKITEGGLHGWMRMTRRTKQKTRVNRREATERKERNKRRMVYRRKDEVLNTISNWNWILTKELDRDGRGSRGWPFRKCREKSWLKGLRRDRRKVTDFAFDRRPAAAEEDAGLVELAEVVELVEFVQFVVESFLLIDVADLTEEFFGRH